MDGLESLLRANLGERKPWTLPARRLGGTEISAVIGINPYIGPLDVYNRIVHGFQAPTNPRMERGTREEPVIRIMFVRETGAVLAPHPGIVYHPEHEFASISPDDYATIDGKAYAVDYKSVSRWSAKKWGLAGTDDIPEHYALQLHWSMAITGKREAILYAAFGEDMPDGTFSHRWQAPYFLKYDSDIAAALLRAGERFWNEHVLPQNPPPAAVKAKKTRKKEAVK